MNINPESESKFAFYEIKSFFCPQVPLQTCDQEVDGKNAIIIVASDPSDIQEYAAAFESASSKSPQCTVHFVPMIPLIAKMKTSL